MKTIKVNGDKFQLFMSAATIRKRVKELAATLKSDLKGQDPLFVCMLNGASVFTADLLRAMDTPAEIAYIKWTSYNGTKSGGEINKEMPLDRDVKGRNVVVVEDIVDTGATMSALKKHIMELGANSCRIVALMCKPNSIKYDISVDYVGFNIGGEFIIGNGFDLDGKYRGLKDIYQKV